jgi:hypothetical protein
MQREVAAVTIFFAESVSSFLDTESLAGLGELTTHRLLRALSILIEMIR